MAVQGRAKSKASIRGFGQQDATRTARSTPAWPGLAVVVFDEQGGPVQPISIVAVLAENGALPAPEMPMQPVTAAGFQFELRVPVPARPVTFGWAVRARGEIRGGLFDRVAAGAFRAQAAGGRIDATAARVEKRNGDLQPMVPAEIHAPGSYWVYAELRGGAGGTPPGGPARAQPARGVPASSIGSARPTRAGP